MRKSLVRRIKTCFLIAAVVVGLLRGSSGFAGAAPAPHKSYDAAFSNFLAAEWDYTMQQDPVWASTLGDRRWNDRWEDLSAAAAAHRHAHDVALLDSLSRLDRARLSTANALNYDLFRQKLEMQIALFDYGMYLVPLTQRGGIQQADQIADQLRFDTVRDYEDWIARLRSFPTLADQTIEEMRLGMKRHVLMPRVVMERVTAQITHQIVKDPETSPFYRPFQRFPPTMVLVDRERLREEARQAITRGVVPSFERLADFFSGQYLPACLPNVGLWQIPNGDRLYALLVRDHTTTDLTPRQIHDIGLGEVARIHGEMEALLKRVGFPGDLKQFFKFLRTDGRFYHASSEELLTAYRAIAKRIDPRLVKLFRLLPRMPYGVEPIPAESAPDTTTAYYNPPAADGSRAGTFYVNLYKPETRPKWEMMALALHESVPGHHLQIALAMEAGGLPQFRRHAGYSAFVEGWGLYAESLGDEMGLYDDPYSKFGELTYEMWRAVRLVVDTGMHAMRWDRERAVQYFLDNTPRQEFDVRNEIDRYITDPGQALAYKIGELRIHTLRDRARLALGTAFDIREFHDVVLREGAIPLNILERNVDAWIARRKAGR